MPQSEQLPLVIAGPILRRVTPNEITLWLATTHSVEVKIDFHPSSDAHQSYTLTPNSAEHICLDVSPHLHYQLLNLTLTTPLPTDSFIEYQVWLRDVSADQTWQAITDLAPHLCYPGQEKLQFCMPSRVTSLLHGSCRKPHSPTVDGLTLADHQLEQLLKRDPKACLEHWPSFLMMSGDQIYADDVAGPMLHAIHQLIDTLSFELETWQTDPNTHAEMTSDTLYQHPHTYYERSELLPSSKDNTGLVNVLFGGAQKPIFTSTDADNHLITLGEYLSCYLLSWSPIPWTLVNLDAPKHLNEAHRKDYANEKQTLENFIAGLNQVQRLMAHLPVAMMMDDHDITDDFNLHRNWEETVYNHPLSKRMVGNGMLAYFINQGWGNKPEAFKPQLIKQIQAGLKAGASDHYNQLLDKLITLEAWDFEWETSPPLIVLDTRTRRWRSERSAFRPSGLLDWEALTELQSRLSGHSAVLLVSATPIFGVKLIEVIQRFVTFLGYPLTVDAEYWMAHPGTAHGILNVFGHRKTPQNFVVLSGDVHYSFVYDVELRGQKNNPEIWQICSSGLRNTFPEPLLSILDKLNRWLYSPKSPLNWFTRRRKMRITPRKPLGTPSGRRLLNQSGIGWVELDESGKPTRICQLVATDKSVGFEKRSKESIWS
ncbi:MAG: alkaline phosphatase family protein [Vibrio sp.]